jgi:hypothetical protein
MKRKLLIRLVTPEQKKDIDDLLTEKKHMQKYPGGKKKEKKHFVKEGEC